MTHQQGKYSANCLFEGWKIEGRDLKLRKPNKSECHKNEIGFAEEDAIKVSVNIPYQSYEFQR